MAPSSPLEEAVPKTQQDELLAEVVGALTVLLGADPMSLAGAIDRVLERIGTLRGADRAYVIRLCNERWVNTNEWCAPGASPVKALISDLPLSQTQPADTALLAGEVILVPSVAALPPSGMRATLEAQGVRALVVVPLLDKGRTIGLLGFDRTGEGRGFDATDVWLLERLSQGMVAALARSDAEAALEQAHAEERHNLLRLRAVLNAMPELVLEIDEDGRCTAAHCTEPNSLVGTIEDIIGRTLEETLPPEIAALQRAAMADARENCIARTAPYRLQTVTGLRWFQLTVSRITDTAAGYVFRIEDITENHARDAETAMLVDVTRQMSNMAVVLGADGRIVWVNPACEAVTGWSLEELRGQDPAQMPLSPETDPGVFAAISEAIAARRPHQAEICKRDRAGSVYWVHVDTKPRHGTDGSFLGTLVIETPITRLKAQQAELRALATQARTAEQRLIDAVEALPDVFVLYDRDDRLLLCNRAFREVNAAVGDLIRPGVQRVTLLEAATRRQFFRETGRDVERLTKSSDETGTAAFEMTLIDGRIFRVLRRRTAGDGHVVMATEVTQQREMQRRLEDVIEGANIATWDHIGGRGMESVNRQWANLLGFGANDPQGIDDARWHALCHPEDHGRIKASLEEVIDGRAERLECECRLRHRDGGWVHISLRGRAVARDEGGRALRLSGIAIDITERRRVEERLSTILEATSIGTWQIVDGSGSVVIDDRYAAMLGYSRADLEPYTAARFRALVHPGDFAAMIASITERTRRREPDMMHEFRMRHRDGRWIWVLSRSRVLSYGPLGQPAEESGIHIDISAQKARDEALRRAEDALDAAQAAKRAAERRFVDIAAVSNEWFWEQDADLRFTYCSSGFTRATGVPVEAVLGHTREELGIARNNADRGEVERLQRAVARREPFTDVTYSFGEAAQGPTRWIRINGAPHFDNRGKFLGYRGVGTEVTALVEARERAEAASRAKSQFLANMSHELRTPMTGVLGMTEILRDSVLNDDQRQMLDTIRASGEGLMAILNDILDLAKIEAGKLELEPRAFVPAELAMRTQQLFDARARSAGLGFAVTACAQCKALVTGDTDRILQILNNLIGNALKFTPQGDVRVEFSMLAEETPNAGAMRLQVTVSDTGIGMTTEQLARVFNEFEQAEGSTARRFGGTGLGLSITRQLLALMGGTISMDSRRGKGTRVAIVLPLARATAPAAKAEGADGSPTAPPRPRPGLRVLLADDNATNRRILDAMLRGLDAEVTQANDGLDVVRRYAPGRFDVLLLDISMPGIDGIQALDLIRLFDQANAAPSLPAIAISANAMRHQVDEYLAAGFAGHVAKPFRGETLAAALVEALPPFSSP